MKQFGIGQPVRRVEDRRFITGRGNYLDDITRPRQAYAFMLRSPHAHARIRAIDTTAAAAAPGVLAVFTGEDLARDGLGTIPCLSAVTNRDGSPSVLPPRPAIAGDRVRHVGDTVAMVVAESLAAARDAAELIAVDYEPLARRGRHRARSRAGAAAGVGRGAGQSLLRLGGRRRRRGRAGDDRGAPPHRARARQQPHRRQFDGAARRHRRIRSGRGRLHPVELDPGLAFRAQPAGRERLQDPGKPHPRRDPRRRRRLRHEAFSLSRARPGAVGGEEARPRRSNGPPSAPTPS